MVAVMMCTREGVATTYTRNGPIVNVSAQTLYVIRMTAWQFADIVGRIAKLAFHPFHKSQIFIQLVETYVEFVLNPK